MCVSDTRSCGKAICEQSRRELKIRRMMLIPTTRMTMAMMMKTFRIHRRSRFHFNLLPARSFQKQSHFDGQRRNSAEHLNLASQPLGGVFFLAPLADIHARGTRSSGCILGLFPIVALSRESVKTLFSGTQTPPSVCVKSRTNLGQRSFYQRC